MCTCTRRHIHNFEFYITFVGEGSWQPEVKVCFLFRCLHTCSKVTELHVGREIRTSISCRATSKLSYLEYMCEQTANNFSYGLRMPVHQKTLYQVLLVYLSCYAALVMSVAWFVVVFLFFVWTGDELLLWQGVVTMVVVVAMEVVTAVVDMAREVSNLLGSRFFFWGGGGGGRVISVVFNPTYHFCVKHLFVLVHCETYLDTGFVCGWLGVKHQVTC